MWFIYLFIFAINFFFSDQPEIITHPKNVTVEEGLPMTLFCNATGNPPPTLSWTKDGSPINNNQGIPFSGDNETLFIASINRSESGNYRCVARNGLGNDFSNPAKVDVQCKCSCNSFLFFFLIWKEKFCTFDRIKKVFGTNECEGGSSDGFLGVESNDLRNHLSNLKLS